MAAKSSRLARPVRRPISIANLAQLGVQLSDWRAKRARNRSIDACT